MSLSASRPSYTCEPIRSLATLGRATGVPATTLCQLASDASKLYRLAKPIVKADGSVRQPFDALPSLKAVHRQLKTRILSRVVFPSYLTGSLKGRDAIRNASLHAGAAIVVTEDISNFFPSVSVDIVFDIWRGFFGFSTDVARVLTSLCTKDGALPQGAIPSSYLANLAFWDSEWQLYERLKASGISYSRYVDDVTVSSKTVLNERDLTACIGRVYGLMASKGLRPKRRKQKISRGYAPMVATKLVVNRHPAIPARERSAIRAAVHHLELALRSGTDKQVLAHEIARVAGRVGRLAQLHPAEASALKARLAKIRDSMCTGPLDVSLE